ncbi:hypothetical protein CLOM_g17308 [Closterium sp. NIES-68]|nr:hypothetical protein CLOM_g17308 [Closterium sp. NIES-68]
MARRASGGGADDLVVVQDRQGDGEAAGVSSDEEVQQLRAALKAAAHKVQVLQPMAALNEKLVKKLQVLEEEKRALQDLLEQVLERRRGRAAGGGGGVVGGGSGAGGGGAMSAEEEQRRQELLERLRAKGLVVDDVDDLCDDELADGPGLGFGLFSCLFQSRGMARLMR